MNKIKYIYKIIAQELILKKYDLNVSTIINGIKISKKQFYKDIKSGLIQMHKSQLINAQEGKYILANIKSLIKNSHSVQEAMLPFLLSANSKLDDTLDD